MAACRRGAEPGDPRCDLGLSSPAPVLWHHRVRRPLRGLMAAVAMWTIWTVAYLAGFSSTSWYPAFHHLAGRGLSARSQSAVRDGSFVARGGPDSFMPVVFWNLLAWLRSEESREINLYGSMAGDNQTS